MCKKKVGLVTIISYESFGAVLQVYATQTIIDSLGYECTLIDTRKTNTIKTTIFKSNNSFANILRNIRAFLNYSGLRKRENLFKQFIRKKIRMTENYEDIKALKNAGLDMGIYITGSDQTFNKYLEAYNPAYFLTFIDDKLKISYASSFGEQIDRLTLSDKEEISSYLKKYDAISVRELSGQKLIEELIYIKPTVVLDPTLLLSQSQIREITGTLKIKEPYLFFYSVYADTWLTEKVVDISKKTGLKVIVAHLINRYEFNVGFKHISDVGPSEFLSLIKNATLVCTSSFHGTVFSIIFEKPFYAFSFGAGNRISSLLNMLELKDRLVSQNDNIDNVSLRIDYTKPYKILKDERKKSIDFLKGALEVSKHETNM